MWPEAITPALNALALACACLSVAAAGWMVFRALPATLEKRLREAERMALDSHQRAGQLSTSWAAFLEDAERVLLAVERKRASVSAAEHRRNANAGPDSAKQPQTRDEWRAWAAGQGVFNS